MRAQQAEQLRNRLEEAAVDIGRLRRRLTRDIDVWTLDRISGHIECVYCCVSPTAAELAAVTAPGDTAAIDEAIRLVDERCHQLRTWLGLEAA